MNDWNHPGVPHRGWACVEMIDLKAGLDEEAVPDGVCQMCGQTEIRYLHIMRHPGYPDDLEVGCVCAGHMEQDYENPKQRERALRNRDKRLRTFLNREWRLSRNDNLVLRYKKKRVTILDSKFDNRRMGVACGGMFAWKYRGKPITTLREAKLAAFEMLDG
jgi:hypothetical protein